MLSISIEYLQSIYEIKASTEQVEMTCKYLTEDKPMPIKETADLSELRNMFGEFLASFIRLSKIICPGIAEHRIFQDWLKDVFCVTENTEVYETDFHFSKKILASFL